jgi:hypothetical protein
MNKPVGKPPAGKPASKQEVSQATENYFEKYGKAATTHAIVGRLLRFSKFGEYRAGQEEEEIATGTRMAVYMNSFSVGFQKWLDNRPADRVMGAIGAGFVPPRREDLGDNDKSLWDTFDDGRPKDPWQFTNMIVLIEMETSNLFTFSTASRGGLDTLGQLSLKYGERLRQHPGEVPIVELDRSSYQHSDRKVGEVRVPILRIVDWIRLTDLPPLEGAQQQELLPDSSKTGGAGGAAAPPSF